MTGVFDGRHNSRHRQDSIGRTKDNSDIHKIYPPIVLSRVEMKIFVREALCMQKIGVYCAIRCSWTAKWGQLCKWSGFRIIMWDATLCNTRNNICDARRYRSTLRSGPA